MDQQIRSRPEERGEIIIRLMMFKAHYDEFIKYTVADIGAVTVQHSNGAWFYCDIYLESVCVLSSCRRAKLNFMFTPKEFLSSFFPLRNQMCIS